MTVAVEEVCILQNLARLYWEGKPKVAAAQAAYFAEVAACEQKVKDMGMGKVYVLRLHVRNAVKDILFPTAYRRDVAYAFLHWQNRRARQVPEHGKVVARPRGRRGLVGNQVPPHRP